MLRESSTENIISCLNTLRYEDLQHEIVLIRAESAGAKEDKLPCAWTRLDEGSLSITRCLRAFRGIKYKLCIYLQIECHNDCQIQITSHFIAMQLDSAGIPGFLV